MNTNPWIPITTPPDDERLVLGCVKDAYGTAQCPQIVYYDEGKWYDGDSDEIISDGWIDHWMDIPDFDNDTD